MVLIGLTAFFASILTFFSGFGLGSLLLPVYAIFFPIEIAVGATAVVHFSNNLVKLSLIGKSGHWKTLKSFGITAFLFAFLGSFTLLWFSGFKNFFEYHALGKTFAVPIQNFLIGILMVIFVLFEEFGGELSPKLLKNLPLGGAVSGFFGGFSGHQGALRSMFLIRLGLSKEQFIATGIWIAVMVDIARLSIYQEFFGNMETGAYILWPLIVGVVSAIAGAMLGRQLLKKVTLGLVNKIVAFGILIIAVLLMLGVV